MRCVRNLAKWRQNIPFAHHQNCNYQNLNLDNEMSAYAYVMWIISYYMTYNVSIQCSGKHILCKMEENGTFIAISRADCWITSTVFAWRLNVLYFVSKLPWKALVTANVEIFQKSKGRVHFKQDKNSTWCDYNDRLNEFINSYDWHTKKDI